MILLNTIAAITFTLYLAYIWYILGYTPKSLSQSFYDIKEKTRKFNWQFIAMLMFCSIDLTYFGWVNWQGGSFPLIIIGSFGILGVAQFTLFKKKLVGIMHYINAVIGFSFSILYFGFNLGEWDEVIYCALFGLLTVIFAPKGQKIFWLEVILAYCLIICLYFY